MLFRDDDGVRSTEDRGKRAARYQGLPVVLVLDPAKKVRIVATDCFASEAVVGPLWLHRWDGARKKLTEGKSVESPAGICNSVAPVLASKTHTRSVEPTYT